MAKCATENCPRYMGEVNCDNCIKATEPQEVAKIKVVEAWGVIEETIGSETDSKHIIWASVWNRQEAENKAIELRPYDTACKYTVIPITIKGKW